MQTLLFFSRLVIYLLLVASPLWLKPAVAVAYDSVAITAWFFLAPLQMFVAYFLHPSRLRSRNIYLAPLIAVGSTFFLTFFFSGLEKDAIFLYFGLAFFSFLSTRMIFFAKRISLLAAFELFFFAFVYFSFLSFTRSAPEISRDHPTLAKSLLFLMLLSLLFHSALIYLAAFPDRSFQKKRNELLALSCVLLPTFLLLSFLSPQDFVDHEISFNQWNEEPPPKPRDLKGEGSGQEGGEGKEEKEDDHRNGLPLGERDEKYPTELQGGDQKQKNVPEKETRPEEKEKGKNKEKEKQKDSRSQKKEKQGKGKEEKEKEGGGGGSGGQEQFEDPSSQGEQDERGGGGQGSGSGKKGPRLEGVPADQWNNYSNSQGEGKNNKQNAVMVVASQINPVYAAQAYLGTFDEEEGLIASAVDTEPLNQIAEQHLIETWQDRIRSPDDKREIHTLFFLSTIKQRVLPYRPHRIQPTVQNVVYHPFDLSYHAQSRISVSQPDDWLLTRAPNAIEKKRMQHYLELKLDPKAKLGLQKHLKRALRAYTKVRRKEGRTGPERYFEKIDSILRGFANHRYELGFDEKMNLEKIHEFLIKDKKGDCTEFAHASAVLARMMGAPSRVVIGYLASRDLQTPAHRGAIYNLQKRIKLLQEYPREELYLVTTSHYHAWVQFWLPAFGWIDFETTSFAIPPKPNMDPNNMDVVIPLIEEEKIFEKPSFVFPWRLVLRILAYIAVTFVLVLYGYRYGRQSYYWLMANIAGATNRGLRALQMRLLLRLANSSYPLKSHYQTTLEYSEKVSLLEPFAKLYTMLRFREQYEPGEREEKLKELGETFQRSFKDIGLQRPNGVLPFLKRIFTLRNLHY